MGRQVSRFPGGGVVGLIRQIDPTKCNSSMRMLLPMDSALAALEKGWGVVHPLTDSISGEHSEYVMTFGPRNESELKVAWIIAQISYYQACSLSMGPKS